MKMLDVETFLKRVRKRETKSQLSVEDSVRLWLMRVSDGEPLSELSPDGFPYTPLKPRRITFNQKEAKA